MHAYFIYVSFSKTEGRRFDDSKSEYLSKLVHLLQLFKCSLRAVFKMRIYKARGNPNKLGRKMNPRVLRLSSSG